MIFMPKPSNPIILLKDLDINKIDSIKEKEIFDNIVYYKCSNLFCINLEQTKKDVPQFSTRTTRRSSAFPTVGHAQPRSRQQERGSPKRVCSTWNGMPTCTAILPWTGDHSHAATSPCTHRKAERLPVSPTNSVADRVGVSKVRY